MLYCIFLFYFFGDIQTPNDIQYEVMSGFIFSTDQSPITLLNL